MGWTPALQAGYSDRFDSDILHHKAHLHSNTYWLNNFSSTEIKAVQIRTCALTYGLLV